MHPDRPRLLVLTPRFPYPVVGGDRLRIHSLCRALSARHSLTLLSLCETQAEMAMPLPQDGVYDRVLRVRLPTWRSRLNVLGALAGSVPLQVAYYRSRRFAKLVDEQIGGHALCLAHLIRTGDYVRHSAIPTAVEMTDAISMSYSHVSKYRGLDVRKYIYMLERKRLRAYEEMTPSNHDMVSLISRIDAENLYGPELPDNVIIASNGVDVSALPFRDRRASSGVCVFIGSMTSLQNISACDHFIENILPRLDDSVLSEFRIVGRISEATAKRFARHRRVTVTGEVISIPDTVSDAGFGVCPVVMGAGVQNKILEYMALGLPVVTSTIGFEGLQARQQEDLLVAENETEFADAIIRIRNDEVLATALARNGRRYVEQHHDWNVVLRPITERIETMVSKHT